MPYPMIHLQIAKKILDDSVLIIEDKPQFYLGTLSPDAVQFREVYDKKLSHIVYSNVPWGFVVDNDEWIKDLFGFFHENYGKTNKSFLFGYLIHILADIYNNIKIWTPFRLKNSDKNFRELHEISYKENMIIDLKLFQECMFIKELWIYLKESISFNFLNIVNKTDMDNIKNQILNIQYKNKEPANDKKNTIVTYSNIIKFINETVAFIIDLLKKEEKIEWKQ